MACTWCISVMREFRRSNFAELTLSSMGWVTTVSFLTDWRNDVCPSLKTAFMCSRTIASRWGSRLNKQKWVGDVAYTLWCSTQLLQILCLVPGNYFDQINQVAVQKLPRRQVRDQHWVVSYRYCNKRHGRATHPALRHSTKNVVCCDGIDTLETLCPDYFVGCDIVWELFDVRSLPLFSSFCRCTDTSCT